jgi:hypothetical protein
MRHLKAKDTQHTVIMVQVENEPGSWNTVRDYSPEAQKLFTSPVPAELLPAMGTNAPLVATGPKFSAPTPTNIFTPGTSRVTSARSPPPARRNIRCRCMSMPRCAIH